MRNIDESFQRMVSKRYDVDFKEIKQSKSLFESLDECDKKVQSKKLTESYDKQVWYYVDGEGL